ncbi:MAG: HAD family phosphatase, partial [Clostridiales bacterium]|nr:HAD family phosphatase [Clostridiales bacterium]
MLENYNGVIFDLDGTLIDSMKIWEDVDRDYLKRHNYEVPRDLQKEIEGKSFYETAMYFKERFNILDSVDRIMGDWYEMAEEFYRERVNMKDSTIELLERIKMLNKPIAIATSNSRELALMALEKNNIRSYFDIIVTSCDVEKGKPSPDVFLEAANQISIDPRKCLVFEDTYAGVLGA